MTTYTIFSKATDHRVWSTSAAYATARAGGTLQDNTTAASDVGQAYTGSAYYCFQLFISFDTSGVPAGTPSENVKLAIRQFSGSAASFIMAAGEYPWTGGTGDFIPGANLAALPGFGQVTIPVDGGNIWREIAGPADVARNASYRLALWSRRQQNNNTPTGFEHASFLNGRHVTPANHPYLTIVLPNEAVAAIAEADDTLVAAGETHLDGAASITEAGDTLAAHAQNLVRGAAAIAEDDDMIVADASALVPVTTPAARRLVFASSLRADRTIRFSQ